MLATLIAVFLLVAAGSPAAALSCEEPEPFDMAAAIADADAAAVGVVRSIIEKNRTEYDDATLILSVEVTEVFKGTLPRRLVLERSSTVWGPYYEQGYELALLEQDGFIDDGRNSLCGPFYTADDMRGAGGTPTIVEPTPQGWLGWLMDLLRLVMAVATA